MQRGALALRRIRRSRGPCRAQAHRRVVPLSTRAEERGLCQVNPVPVRCGRGEPSPRADVAGGEARPGAEGYLGVSPFPAPMRDGSRARAQSSCSHGTGEPSPRIRIMQGIAIIGHFGYSGYSKTTATGCPVPRSRSMPTQPQGRHRAAECGGPARRRSLYPCRGLSADETCGNSCSDAPRIVVRRADRFTRSAAARPS